MKRDIFSHFVWRILYNKILIVCMSASAQLCTLLNRRSINLNWVPDGHENSSNDPFNSKQTINLFRLKGYRPQNLAVQHIHILDIFHQSFFFFFSDQIMMAQL